MKNEYKKNHFLLGTIFWKYNTPAAFQSHVPIYSLSEFAMTWTVAHSVASHVTPWPGRKTLATAPPWASVGPASESWSKLSLVGGKCTSLSCRDTEGATLWCVVSRPLVALLSSVELNTSNQTQCLRICAAFSNKWILSLAICSTCYAASNQKRIQFIRWRINKLIFYANFECIVVANIFTKGINLH